MDLVRVGLRRVELRRVEEGGRGLSRVELGGVR